MTRWNESNGNGRNAFYMNNDMFVFLDTFDYALHSGKGSFVYSHAATFFADKILPIFYKQKKLLRCFFTTALDPTWRNYIIDLYSKWEIDIYQRKYTEFHLSNCAMTRMFIESTISIISIVEAWICQDEPVSAEIFRTDFLRLVSTPFSNLLVVN